VASLEALASTLINALPLECGRTPAKPKGRENLALKKLNCLSAVSFEFLVKVCLE